MDVTRGADIQAVLSGRMSWHIETADVIDGLGRLSDNCIDCIVTSPPYYALRDYNTPGQIGLESTVQQYVERLVGVFAECKRVLKPSGTFWLVMGDSYSGSGKGRLASGLHAKNAGDKQWTNKGTVEGRILTSRVRASAGGPGPKNLLGVPWRLAFALQDDGWTIRSDIIWHKTAPMTESVTDRCTSSHEHIFMFSKAKRYFFDAHAIAEPSVSKHGSGNGYKRSARLSYADKNGPRGQSEPMVPTEYRNARDVWTIGPDNFSGKHFATFPVLLPTRAISAGTSERGYCPACGKPWRRVIERTAHVNTREPAHVPGASATKTDSTGWAPRRRATDRWEPGCVCEAGEPVSGIVLDPFVGSGTSVLVALRLGRRGIGIDNNAEYADMARARILGDAPLLNQQEGVA